MGDPAPYLVVGLGNPGAEYEGTRHNFGFQVVEVLARRTGIRLKTREAQAITGRGRMAGREVWLAEPLTFMNLSGEAVRQLLARREVSGWLVVYDELDLPLGTIRLRERGSAGSHNGLKSVTVAVGSAEFARLRLGIGPPPAPEMRVDFVLGRWKRAERTTVAEVAERAADAVEMILTEGMARAMNRFNTAPPEATKE